MEGSSVCLEEPSVENALYTLSKGNVIFDCASVKVCESAACCGRCTPAPDLSNCPDYEFVLG